ncbi:uncharacterized protein EV420DRAFT_1651862 [Desarmillaria tabescens]|uniref:Uncharacterized protein n=1 Tax=Armillaria tabescens TaxID=1929756 RepID=A0AA39ML07_ARMTA|nr:uncharacterized protein EV420DRAFT_1651862 [Desarmillaria tabescens]KAK0437599.1 hypothetical protein EV420DRAFT_1651862 [Desarmillaria tabescens]
MKVGPSRTYPSLWFMPSHPLITPATDADILDNLHCQRQQTFVFNDCYTSICSLNRLLSYPINHFGGESVYVLYGRPLQLIAEISLNVYQGRLVNAELSVTHFDDPGASPHSLTSDHDDSTLGAITALYQPTSSLRSVIQSAQVNTPCIDLGIDEVLKELNVTLDAPYTPDDSALEYFISQNYDFRTVYANFHSY